MILSSRVARTAGVIYFSELHLLVFLVLYRLVYTETSYRGPPSGLKSILNQ